jgi:NADPH:quinone reductase-like Zn-dependent oxidoreductase
MARTRRWCVVPAANLHPKPRHLSWEEAAAVPLASVTAYRALVTRARLQAGETYSSRELAAASPPPALVIARQLGATVWVTSGHDSKLKAARTHGAAAA